MNKMIAYCGLDCQTCTIYLATREESKGKQEKMRKKTVQLIKQHYGLNCELKDITDCDGCMSETGRLYSACKDCPIRICARQKGIKNCAYCDEYICRTREEFFVKELDAKKRLDAIRNPSV